MWHVPLVLPCAHHAAQRHEIAIAGVIAGADRLDVWPRIRRRPATAVVRVRVRVADLVLVEEARNDLERHVVIKCNDDDLPITADV